MKIAITIILCYSFFFPVLAQQITVHTTYKNIVYLGVNNATDIIVPGYKLSDLSVTSDNGTIEKGEFAFVIHPEHLGTLNLTIKASAKEGVRDIGTQTLPVQCLEADVTFAGKKSGELRAATARQAIGFSAPVIKSMFDAQAPVVQARVRIIRNYVEIVNKFLDNNDVSIRFYGDSEVQQAISNLMKGDILRFSEIKYKVDDSCLISVPDMEFTITD